jgi:hypothetical protein
LNGPSLTAGVATGARIPSALVALIAVSALLAACGGTSSDAQEPPLHEDFADCEGFTMSDDVATVDCPEGELRVLVGQPKVSGTHFVPFRFDPGQRALDVSAQARAAVAGGAWGVGCLGSVPGEAARGYLFVISPAGAAAIFRVGPASDDAIDGRVPQEFELLEDRDEAVPHASGKHVLRIRCARAADTGAVRVQAFVDGAAVLATTDSHDGVAPFTGAFSSVLTDKAGTDIRFDDVSVSGIEAGEPAVDDQEARIGIVAAAAAKRTSYGNVAEVFCQDENHSCVVTYLVDDFPACQDWHVESTNGVLVAIADEDPFQGLEAKYDPDEPDRVGCGQP